MVLTEGMDEGPVLATERTPIGTDETAGELGERLAVVGGPLLERTLPGYLDGSVDPVPQDDAAATYAAKITGDDARIDWTDPAARIRDLIRGVNPAPGAWTTLRGERVKVHRAEVVEVAPEPGVIAVSDDLIVGTGAGGLRLTEVQPAGKKRMEGAEMKRGLRGVEGERFG